MQCIIIIMTCMEWTGLDGLVHGTELERSCNLATDRSTISAVVAFARPAVETDTWMDDFTLSPCVKSTKLGRPRVETRVESKT
jgi:hypothetical protein